MSAPDEPRPAVATDASGHLTQDTPCIRCGYNLRGLHVDSVCPECGTSVSQSLHGPYLRNADPNWVRTLAGGMPWIATGVTLTILITCLVTYSALQRYRNPGRFDPFEELLHSVPRILILVGLWKVTVPDPREDQSDVGYSTRSLVRITAVADLALTPAAWIAISISQALIIVFVIIGLVIVVTEYFAFFTHVRRLALRIPDRRLAFWTRIIMWGIAVLATVFCIWKATVMNSLGIPTISGRCPAAGLALPVLLVAFAYRHVLSQVADEARAAWARNEGASDHSSQR
jgi:hypothetical protein